MKSLLRNVRTFILLLTLCNSGAVQARVLDLYFDVDVLAHYVTTNTNSGNVDDASFVPTHFQYTIRVDTAPSWSGFDSQEGYSVAVLSLPAMPATPFTGHLLSLYPTNVIQTGSQTGGSDVGVTRRSNGDQVITLEQNLTQGLYQYIPYDDNLSGNWLYSQSLTLMDWLARPYTPSQTPFPDSLFVEDVFANLLNKNVLSIWSESAGYSLFGPYHIGTPMTSSTLYETYTGEAQLVAIRDIPEPSTFLLTLVGIGLIWGTLIIFPKTMTTRVFNTRVGYDIKPNRKRQ